MSILIEIIFRKSVTPPNDSMNRAEYLGNNEEIVSNKGQAKSLKNRFIELEQDARKVETASSKLKYTPKRFVVCIWVCCFCYKSSYAKILFYRVRLHPNNSMLKQVQTWQNALDVIKQFMPWRK